MIKRRLCNGSAGKLATYSASHGLRVTACPKLDGSRLTLTVAGIVSKCITAGCSDGCTRDVCDNPRSIQAALIRSLINVPLWLDVPLRSLWAVAPSLQFFAVSGPWLSLNCTSSLSLGRSAFTAVLRCLWAMVVPNCTSSLSLGRSAFTAVLRSLWAMVVLNSTSSLSLGRSAFTAVLRSLSLCLSPSLGRSTFTAVLRSLWAVVPLLQLFALSGP